MHYNVGHIVAAEGDTVSPDGGYLVSLNKWSVDRFLTVGPLHPQNFQLHRHRPATGDSMQLLYDMPIGHRRAALRADDQAADKLDAWEIYPGGRLEPA